MAHSWHSAGALVGCARLLIALLVFAPVARAEDVLPVVDAPAVLTPAESVLRAAFANLFELDAATRVESTRSTSDGAVERSTFSIYRKRIGPDSQRLLVVTPDPEAPEQRLRMLEILEGVGRRARLYAPRIDPEPMVTRYRLTDPFLGSFSNSPPEEVRADLGALSRAYEIIERLPGTLAGDEVDRIVVRPLAARRLERVELWIALDAPVILEYRYFEAGDARPARVARAPRASMRSFEGRLLPGVLVYEDRIEQSTTRVELRYEALPADLGDAPFMESSFHRASLPE